MNKVSLILQWKSVFLEAKMSKWSHFMSWPVVFTWSAMADEWPLLARALKCSVFLFWQCRIHHSSNNQLYRWPWTSEIGSSDLCMENRIWCGVCFGIWPWDWQKSRNCIRRISDVLWFFLIKVSVCSLKLSFYDLHGNMLNCAVCRKQVD